MPASRAASSVDERAGQQAPLIPPRQRLGPRAATTIYLAVALAFTWPLALGLTRDIPWDLGDSLLNAWILAWDAERLLRLLSGDPGALQGFWTANIFHPEPLTLAYSEHLIAQAVQILPVYALTGNVILCYNLLFLSSFVLSGLGMYLFVREVTGSPRAGFVAGLIYAFAPYRVPQFAHLQVLSSQWMPFALYGLRRYFDSRRLAPLAGAGAAMVAQNLSNGYFLLFFPPFAAAYVLFEIASRRLWRDVRVWTALAATAVAVALLTLPFLVPYLQLRRLGFPARSLAEVMRYSADVFSYWTAPPESHVWGRAMRALPRPEGDLFPTFSALLLAAAGLTAAIRSAWRRSRGAAIAVRGLDPLAGLLLGIAIVDVLLLGILLAGGRLDGLALLGISVRGIGRPAVILGIALALLVGVSPRARAFARAWLGSVTTFAVLAVALAVLLSLGPAIRADGRLIGEVGPYSLLYAYVPGFDGLRVPARYAMLVMLFLSIAAGAGAAAAERRGRRGGALALLLGGLAVAESFAAPIIVNGTVAEGGYLPPPARVYTPDQAPPVYRFLKTLPAPGTVIVEFPFGEPAYEVRYMFYSTGHWHPLLNGYSGTFPLSYSLHGTLLRHPLESPDLAWTALLESGATHAVVHEKLYKDAAVDLVAWLTARGARQIGDFDGDRVFELAP